MITLTNLQGFFLFLFSFSMLLCFVAGVWACKTGPTLREFNEKKKEKRLKLKS